MQFGKLVVALTFHQVDTSCAGRGRPRQWLLHKATRARNLIQVLNTNGLVGIFGQIFFDIWTNTFGHLNKYILPFGQIPHSEPHLSPQWQKRG